MLTLSSCLDWSTFISVCFVVDSGHIDIKFHPSQGCDRPLLSAEKQGTGCTKPLASILLRGHSHMMSHHSCFKHRPWHVHLLPSAMRTVSVTAWMMTNRQLSFSEWWGLMVYVSAVGSAASVWAGRVIITFITCVGQPWGAGWNWTRIDSGLGHTHTHWQVLSS